MDKEKTLEYWIERFKNENNVDQKRIIAGKIVEILQENPEGFYENSVFFGESIPLLAEYLVGTYASRSNEEKEKVISLFLSHTAVVELVLAEGMITKSAETYIQEYFNKNFETIYKNLNRRIELNGREQDVVKGFREFLLKGIVSQGIIIDKDGNFQTKNAEESLNEKTAKNEFYYRMDEEFVKEILKKVYKLETYTDVKDFYNNIDTILGEDIQTEGTIINSLCNCSELGNMRQFREADDIYGTNTQFEYLKSLAYSTIKDRLENIKRDREQLIGNTDKKKAEIDNMFEGWGKDGEQK